MNFITAATKRLTEREFHVEKYESSLSWATKYALIGDVDRMVFSIRNAQKHAEQAHIPSSEIDPRVEAICNSLGDNEHDFRLHEMKYKLDLATKHALRGNRDDMNIAIASAQKHAKKARVPNSEIYPRVEAIRNSSGNENDFHLHEMDCNLGLATKFALQGNSEMMDFAITKAQTHAEHANIPSSEIDPRVEAIRNSVSNNECNFHLREIESCLGWATKYALEGNHEMMDFAITKVQTYAEQARIPSSEIDPRVAVIRKSLGDNEYDFHLREIESNLALATRYAYGGNRKMMDFTIATAKEHAEKARIPSSRIDSRVEAIRNSFVAYDH